MFYQKGDQINGKYKVLFPLSENETGELYRVRGLDGTLLFLKLYPLDSIPNDCLDENGQVKEIQLRRTLRHANVCDYVDDGGFEDNGNKYAYLVVAFVSAESLAQRLRRTSTMESEEACEIGLALLRLLRTLHARGVAHRNINANTVWLNLTSETNDLRLTDFSKATENGQGLDNDLVAVASLIFKCLTGENPTMPPKLPLLSGKAPDNKLIYVLAKALSPVREQRFATADEFIQALLGKETPTLPDDGKEEKTVVRPHGNGFADVAGMAELKKKLYESVLYVLRDKERAKRYRLTIPNGILLYGPPGCGKTFIAEKFAEEAGYHFRFVKSSDLASIYVHGSQEKIGELFKEARENAPTVLCFDEFDALVPKRTSRQGEFQSGEVNEFLTQLNNCGKDNVFVIATTNQPDLIDDAVLRAGRMDEIIYVPMPDHQARAELFAIHLKDRPYDDSVDFQRLARITENYVASEIALVVNVAARKASQKDEDITQKLLETILSEHKPRFNREKQKYYDGIRQKMENENPERPKIGF